MRRFISLVCLAIWGAPAARASTTESRTMLRATGSWAPVLWPRCGCHRRVKLPLQVLLRGRQRLSDAGNRGGRSNLHPFGDYVEDGHTASCTLPAIRPSFARTAWSAETASAGESSISVTRSSAPVSRFILGPAEVRAGVEDRIQSGHRIQGVSWWVGSSSWVARPISKLRHPLKRRRKPKSPQPPVRKTAPQGAESGPSHEPGPVGTKLLARRE